MNQTVRWGLVWGVVFGIGQATITLIVSARFSSPEIQALSCIGLLSSFGLSFGSGLVGAISARQFMAGLLAGIISTAMDIVAGLAGSMFDPALLQMNPQVLLFSYIVSGVMSVGLSAIGAGAGIIFPRLLARSQN